MRNIFITLAVVCFTSAALAVPSPNITWERGDPGTTWQEWYFDIDDTNPAPPDEGNNPNATIEITATGVSHDFDPGWAPTWHGKVGVWHGERVDVEVYVPNNPVANEYKEIWIQVGFEGDFIGAGLYPQGLILKEEVTLLPDGWKVLDLGWRIMPNPPEEWIDLHFINSGSSVDYVIIDTICAPEPATMCLLGLGALLLKRKH